MGSASPLEGQKVRLSHMGNVTIFFGYEGRVGLPAPGWGSSGGLW